MLKQRIITAIVLVAAFIALLFYASPVVFSGVVLVIMGIAGWEWTRFAINKPNIAHYALFIIPLLAVSYFGTGKVDANSYMLLYGVTWILLTLGVFIYPKSARLWQTPILMYVLGLLMLSLTYWAFIGVKDMLGSMGLLAAVLLVAVGDSGAYFAGKRFGRHKLAPQVSPGKTWQGYLGGMVSVIIVMLVGAGVIMQGELLLPARLLSVVGMAVLLHAVSVIGDLSESMFKRTAGIKDSSQLLPGHGGILDRIDAIIAVLPLVYLFALIKTAI